MSDAAHGGPLTHTVFNEPFEVRPKMELWDTPDNYKRRQLSTEPELPEKLEVWRVQHSGKSYGGVVSRLYGYEDSPDAEILVHGYNEGKEYGAVGIGRHGNVLQWGFSMPPSRMSIAGKKLFLNCICYIARFDGKRPLVRFESSHRDNALRLAALIEVIEDDEFFLSTFPPELRREFAGNAQGLVEYYVKGYELLYRDQHFLVDRDLKKLGFASNREVGTLRGLVGLLEDEAQAALARKLLGRYTDQDFEQAREWKAWFEGNEGRFFFSDVGGYRFHVVPEGYLED